MINKVRCKDIMIIMAGFFLLVLSAIGVLAAPLDAILNPISRLNIAAFYASYGFIIDAMLYFLLLMGAAQAGLGKMFKERSGKAIIVAVGLALSFSVTVWEFSSGFRLANLWPLAIIIVLLTIGIAFYNFVKIGGTLNKGMTLLAFSFLFYFFQGLVPSLANWFNTHPSQWIRLIWALLNILAFFCLIWGVVELIKGLGGGPSPGPKGPAGGRGPPGGPGQPGRQGPAGGREHAPPHGPGEEAHGPERGRGEGPGAGRIVAEITHPRANAPGDPDAVRNTGDPTPIDIRGKISGPHPQYIYIFGIYGIDGFIRSRIAPHAFNQGTEAQLNINTTNVSMVDGTAGQLAPGFYWVVLFAQHVGGEPVDAPENFRQIPEALRITNAPARKIQVRSGGEGGAREERGELDENTQRLLEQLPPEMREEVKGFLGLIKEANELSKRSAVNTDNKHRLIREFLDLYDHGRIDEALQKIIQEKEIIADELKRIEESRSIIKRLIAYYEKALKRARDSNNEATATALEEENRKCKEILALVDKLENNLKDQQKELDRHVGEMKIKSDVLPNLEKLIKKEQGILFEINKYNEAEQKREQELIEKTLARIKAVRERMDRAAETSPAKREMLKPLQIVEPGKKPKIEKVENLSETVQMSIKSMPLSDWEIGINGDDMSLMDISISGKRYLRVANMHGRERVGEWNFRGSTDVDKGLLAMNNIILKQIDLKDGDRVNCAHKRYIYEGGSESFVLELEKIGSASGATSRKGVPDMATVMELTGGLNPELDAFLKETERQDRETGEMMRKITAELVKMGKTEAEIAEIMQDNDVPAILKIIQAEDPAFASDLRARGEEELRLAQESLDRGKGHFERVR